MISRMTKIPAYTIYQTHQESQPCANKRASKGCSLQQQQLAVPRVPARWHQSQAPVARRQATRPHTYVHRSSIQTCGPFASRTTAASRRPHQALLNAERVAEQAIAIEQGPCFLADSMNPGADESGTYESGTDSSCALGSRCVYSQPCIREKAS